MRNKLAGKTDVVTETQKAALVVINRLSGTVRSRGAEKVAELVREKLSPVFPRLDIELCEGDVMPPVRKAAAGNTHQVIIAGGGDGTIASVAGELLDSGIALGALPLGTMNLFVQSLGFSPVLEQSLDQMAAARLDKIDTGSANGRTFLHQVSFGLQPRMARLRERIGYSSRLTKMIAAARAFAVLIARPKLVRVIIEAGGPPRRMKTPILIVSNNPLGAGHNVALPASMKYGKLGMYSLEDVSIPTLVRLAKDYLANRVIENPAVEAGVVEKVRITNGLGRRRTALKQAALLTSMDGEVVVLESPVEIVIRPASLKVLVPAAKDALNEI